MHVVCSEHCEPSAQLNKDDNTHKDKFTFLKRKTGNLFIRLELKMLHTAINVQVYPVLREAEFIFNHFIINKGVLCFI